MPRSKRTWIILGSLGGLLVLLIAATAGTYAHYQGLASKNNLLAAQNSLAASSSTSSSASVPTPTYQPAKEALQTVAASIVLDTTPQTTSSSEAPPPTSTSTTASSSSSTSSTSLSQPTSSKPAAFVTVQVKSTTSTPPVPKSTPSPSPPPATSTVVPIAAPSSSPPSQPATPPSGSSYMLQTYNGVATHCEYILHSRDRRNVDRLSTAQSLDPNSQHPHWHAVTPTHNPDPPTSQPFANRLSTRSRGRPPHPSLTATSPPRVAHTSLGGKI